METVAAAAAPLALSPANTTQRIEYYKSETAMWLSGIQMIIGTLCILLQCILIGLRSDLSIIGHGIWAGSFFALSAGVGIASSKRKTLTLIVAFLTLAVISVVPALAFLTFSSIDMLISMFFPRPGLFAHTISAINAVMVILALSEVVVAIKSSVICCHGLSHANQNQPVVVTGQVQYIQGPDGQQQIVILPLEQQATDLASGGIPNVDQEDPPPYSLPPPYVEGETKQPDPL